MPASEIRVKRSNSGALLSLRPETGNQLPSNQLHISRSSTGSCRRTTAYSPASNVRLWPSISFWGLPEQRRSCNESCDHLCRARRHTSSERRPKLDAPAEMPAIAAGSAPKLLLVSCRSPWCQSARQPRSCERRDQTETSCAKDTTSSPPYRSLVGCVSTGKPTL